METDNAVATLELRAKRRRLNPTDASQAVVYQTSAEVVEPSEIDNSEEENEIVATINRDNSTAEYVRTPANRGHTDLRRDSASANENEDSEADPVDSKQLINDIPIEIADEPVRRPTPEALQLEIDCVIPGSEVSKSSDWDTTRIFYKLEKEFGRNCVLSCRGIEIQKFKNPLKAARDSRIDITDLKLTISTERQYKDIQSRWQRQNAGEEEEEEGTQNDQAEQEGERFPITLQGKHGSVRVSVTNSTKIEVLMQQYLKARNITSSSPSIRFDGDSVDLSQTVGDLGLEEDENLDVYT